jgi:hypothetical protein
VDGGGKGSAPAVADAALQNMLRITYHVSGGFVKQRNEIGAGKMGPTIQVYLQRPDVDDANNADYHHYRTKEQQHTQRDKSDRNGVCETLRTLICLSARMASPSPIWVPPQHSTETSGKCRMPNDDRQLVLD